MFATQIVSNGIAVVVPDARVDSSGAVSLCSDLHRAIAADAHRLVVDMSQVAYIGSKGLQALISALAECRRHGGDVTLAGVTPNVRHVLGLIDFERLFTFCSCVETALAGCRSGRA